MNPVVHTRVLLLHLTFCTDRTIIPFPCAALQVLAVAGASDASGIAASVLILISQTPELYGYVAHKLYSLIEDDTSQLPLVHVAVWCIGEYGEVCHPACVVVVLEMRSNVDPSPVCIDSKVYRGYLVHMLAFSA